MNQIESDATKRRIVIRRNQPADQQATIVNRPDRGFQFGQFYT